MASGKRASMREGPLADLFRKTEQARRAGRRERRPRPPTRAASPRRRRPPPRSAARRSRRRRTRARPATRIRRSARRADAPPAPEPHVPTPQERLRHAFSADIPENILDRQPPAATRRDPYVSRVADEPTPWGTAKPVGQPVLRVVGVGGAGVNAVNRMVEAQVEGVEFIAINTDLQSLQQSTADITLHIGPQVTRGLGAGSNPDLGRQSAMEEYDRIKALLKGSDMVFIAAGAGGGTGTGAAPIVARIARELGALTVGIVTKPFGFEGNRRSAAAEHGRPGAGRRGRHPHRRAQQQAAQRARQADVDGRRLPRGRRRPAPGRAGHQRPRHPAGAHQPRLRRRAHDHVRGRQRAAGHRHGPRRGPRGRRGRAPRPSRRCWRPRWRARARSCSRSPAGPDLSLWEINEAAKAVSEAAHPDANIIFGAMVDEKLGSEVWVTVVATGYTEGRVRPARRDFEEPRGEVRVERRSRPSSTRQTGLGVHELDVPEFIPRPDRLTEDRYELPPARLERWLDRWAARHENVAWTSVGERDVAFVGADGERVVCEPPFPPLDERGARRARRLRARPAARPRPPRAHGRRAARAPRRPRGRRLHGRELTRLEGRQPARARPPSQGRLELGALRAPPRGRGARGAAGGGRRRRARAGAGRRAPGRGRARRRSPRAGRGAGRRSAWRRCAPWSPTACSTCPIRASPSCATPRSCFLATIVRPSGRIRS